MLNTYNAISPLVAESASGRFLQVLQPTLLTQRFGQAETMDKNKGHIYKWRRYLRGGANTAALNDGITPGGNRIRNEDYACVMQQYGDFYLVTDVIEDLHTDPILNQYTDLCGIDAGETVELITIDMLNNGTNVYYTGTATSRGTVTLPAARSDFRRVVRDFERNNVKKITSMIMPTAKISTAGVLGSYVVMGHTDCDGDLRSAQGFRAVSEYGNPDESMTDFGEVGALEKCRIFLTSLFRPVSAIGATTTTQLSGGIAPPGAGAAADVYRLIFCGKDAYGVVRLQGQKVGKTFKSPAEIIVKPVGTGGSEDPLNQRGSIGWKLWYSCGRLDELRIGRLECTATA